MTVPGNEVREFLPQWRAAHREVRHYDGVKRRGSALLAVVLVLVACTTDDEADNTTGTTRATTSTVLASPITAGAPTCVVPKPDQPRVGLDSTVTVFVFCGGGGTHPVDLRAVSRVVPDDGAPLRAAINQLLLGVTPQEYSAGLRSAFHSFTAGQLRGATITDGVATLDFTSGFEHTNNFSTSNLSAVVYSQIEATVFQFEAITGLDYKVDGSRWCGWENPCDDQPVPLRARPDTPPP